MSYKLRILSLGAGVQSSTILLMACKGLIPKPDAAIFADTGWETMATYMHLEWLKVEAGKHGIEVITCSFHNIREWDLTSSFRGGKQYSCMPFHAIEDGNKSMCKRQCTNNFKLQPIKKATRKALGLAPRQHAPKDCVEQWIGISTDECQRIFTRHSDRMTFLRYPLIEMNMSRTDCIKWLMDNYQVTVPKSSCIGCPFHRDREWKALSLDEFRDACEFDNAIRSKQGLRGQAYLHRSCVPLSEVDLSTPEDRGQQAFDFVKDEKLNLFVNNSSIMLVEGE